MRDHLDVAAEKIMVILTAVGEKSPNCCGRESYGVILTAVGKR